MSEEAISPGASYYRARYYDPSTGRFPSEDPWDADPMYNDSDLYIYVENNPNDSTDPFGLYTLNTGVPPPSPALDKFLQCLENYVKKVGGQLPLVVTATTNGKHQDPGHSGGTSVDIRPPGVPSNKLFCAAGQCGAQWGLKETPGNQSYKYTQGYNDHFQLVPPQHPSPKAPNAIPPGCKPGGCSAQE